MRVDIVQLRLIAGALLAVGLLPACQQGSGQPAAAPSGTSASPSLSSSTREAADQDYRPDPRTEGVVVAELPDVGPPVSVDPDERYSFVVNCLADQGFGAKEVYQGMLIDTVPVEQGPVLNAASEACLAKYPLPDDYEDPKTPAQLRVVYRYFRDVLTPCLAAEGVPVGTAPSEGSFVDAGEDYYRVYNPYDWVVPRENAPALYEICPPSPSYSSIAAAK